MDEIRLVYNRSAEHLVFTGQQAHVLLQHYGDLLASRSARRAPRRTGAGAMSIRAEVVLDSGELEVLVSWDKAHYYMSFHQLGTRKLAPRPFMIERI